MTEQEKLQLAIAALDAQRKVLGDLAVEAALAGLQQKLAELDAAPTSLTNARVDAGERKLVTVMFADVSGFTALSERLDPEQIRTLMNACFNRMVPVVEKYGGAIDKFIGDEIMAVFGAPTTHENDAERALRAALEMMERLTPFNAEHGTTLGLHIGINTGPVVAGGLGSDGRQQYSVMGDAVNLASRLEDASETGQILVGPTTYRLTAPLFQFAPLPPIRVKGKAGLIAVYQLIGRKAAPGTTRGIAGLSSPLVGREVERDQLLQLIQRLAEGHGSIVAITGEPGLGKSRLVAEMRQTVAMEVRWAEGRAQSFSEGISYAVVQNMLDNLIGISSDMPPIDIGLALRSTVQQLFPETEQFSEIYPYLARLRDVPLDPDSEARLKGVLPEALQQRMRRAFGDLIEALARLQPLALVWEDLHWAALSSLGLIEALLPKTDEAPIVMLIVFRTQEGRIGEWYQRAVASRSGGQQLIRLTPLSAIASQQLIENLLKIENLPEATRQLILDKAEGNPFFLEELLRSLLDTGMVLLDGDRAVATHAIGQLDVPDTLQGIVAERIDRLPPGDKVTLQTAAVIGRVFQQSVLAYLLEREQASVQLDSVLSELQEYELIRRRYELEYIFKHAVTQDVTYNSLLITRRKELHRVAAEAIEALFPNQLEELSATLAYHYERSAVYDKAIHYLTLAADRAHKTYSNAEAIGYYQAALAQIKAKEEAAQVRDQAAHAMLSAQLEEKLGDVAALTGQSEAAQQAYQAALAQASRQDRVWQARLRRKEGSLWMAQRQTEKSLQAYDLAETVLGPRLKEHDQDWQHEWLEIQLASLWAYYWANQIKEMAALTEKVRSVVEKAGAPGQQSTFFRYLVLLAWRRDRLQVNDETVNHARVALTVARESGDIYEICFATAVLGMCHVWHGMLEEAETVLHQALRLAEQIGDMERIIICLAYLTVTYRRQHRTDKVREYVERSLNAATASNMPFYIGSAKANLAWAEWVEGHLAEAQNSGTEALEVWGMVQHPLKWQALWPLIAIDLIKGQPEAAMGRARALLLPPEMRLPSDLENMVQAAITAWDCEDHGQARTLLEQATALAQQTGWL